MHNFMCLRGISWAQIYIKQQFKSITESDSKSHFWEKFLYRYDDDARIDLESVFGILILICNKRIAESILVYIT